MEDESEERAGKGGYGDPRLLAPIPLAPLLERARAGVIAPLANFGKAG